MSIKETSEGWATKHYEGGTWYWDAAVDGYKAGYRAGYRAAKRGRPGTTVYHISTAENLCWSTRENLADAVDEVRRVKGMSADMPIALPLPIALWGVTPTKDGEHGFRIRGDWER